MVNHSNTCYDPEALHPVSEFVYSYKDRFKPDLTLKLEPYLQPFSLQNFLQGKTFFQIQGLYTS